MRDGNRENGNTRETPEEQATSFQVEIEKYREREIRLRKHYEELAQRYDLLEETVESRMRHRLGQSETRVAKLSKSLDSARQAKDELTVKCRQLLQDKNEIESERERLERRLLEAQRDKERHRGDAEKLRRSLSWRSTAPLRWMKKLVSRT